MLSARSIAQVESGGIAPAFSGGTSLSKGWDLIKRFSEDMDFKVVEPPAPSVSAGQRVEQLSKTHVRRVEPRWL
jgi:predicted nucleotidyltransferase component of viral defense system